MDEITELGDKALIKALESIKTGKGGDDLSEWETAELTAATLEVWAKGEISPEQRSGLRRILSRHGWTPDAANAL